MIYLLVARVRLVGDSLAFAKKQLSGLEAVVEITMRIQLIRATGNADGQELVRINFVQVLRNERDLAGRTYSIKRGGERTGHRKTGVEESVEKCTSGDLHP